MALLNMFAILLCIIIQLLLFLLFNFMLLLNYLIFCMTPSYLLSLHFHFVLFSFHFLRRVSVESSVPLVPFAASHRWPGQSSFRCPKYSMYHTFAISVPTKKARCPHSPSHLKVWTFCGKKMMSVIYFVKFIWEVNFYKS